MQRLAPIRGIAHINAEGIIILCDDDFASVFDRVVQDLIGTSIALLDFDLDDTGPGSFHREGREFDYKWLRGSEGPATLLVFDVDGGGALLESLEAFEHLVEATPVGIVVLDKDKKVEIWNKAAENIFGWTSEEIVGRPYPLVPPAEWPQFCELFDKVMAGEGYRGLESQRSRKDGSIAALSMSTTPIRDASGKVIAALALLNDVSQQKLLEGKLAERARLESVGQLASGVAHDFNNMLTVVMSHCGFIARRGYLERADRESLQIISRCIEQAAELTSQLLTFGRRQIVRPTTVDLNSVTRETIGMLSKVLGPHIALDVEFVAGSPKCRIDVTQYSQLLVNLLTNARDAMPEGGTIKVRTSCEATPAGMQWQVSIADTGSGIAPSDIKHVFEPFFTTKGSGEGSGLGLSTAFGIAEQAGGTLNVTSEVGLGSVFTLSLPLSNEEVSVVAKRPPTEPLRGALKILLVDDDDLVRDSLIELIRDNERQVVPASTGKQALAILETMEFDVIITDVYMPGMNGSELVDQVARRWPDLPVLFMTGNLADPELRGRVEKGLASIIQKPIHPDELERALVAVCSGRVYR